MELVETLEIDGEEREIADAYARGQINASNVATISGMSYSAEGDEIIINAKMEPNATVADRVNWHNDALNGVFDTMTAVKQNISGSLDEINSNLDVLGYGENGVYNLLKPKLLTETTKNGVTCTPNKDANGNFDGTYTLKGTNSGTWNAFPFATIQNLGGTFKFVVRNDVSNALVFIWNSTDNKAHDNFRAYKEVTFDANKIYSVQFVLDKDGAEVNDLFKPMLTADLSATYDDFKPYIPSVAMLAKENSNINESLSVIGKCKNLLNPTLGTTTLNGVTCTANGDGTYTLNGTAKGQPVFTIPVEKTLKKGTKILGCINGSSTTYFITYRTGSNWSGKYDYGNGYVLQDDTIINDIDITVRDGQTVSNIIFKPMITTNLNATYDDFVPYTGDGETLTEDVAALKNDLGGLSFSVSGTTLSITDGTNTWTLSQ